MQGHKALAWPGKGVTETCRQRHLGSERDTCSSLTLRTHVWETCPEMKGAKRWNKYKGINYWRTWGSDSKTWAWKCRTKELSLFNK